MRLIDTQPINPGSSNSPPQTSSICSQKGEPESFPKVGFSVTSTRSFRAKPMSYPESEIKSIRDAFMKELGFEDTRTQQEKESKEKIYSDAKKAILLCAKIIEIAENRLEMCINLNPDFAKQWKKVKAPLEKAQELMQLFDEIRRNMSETTDRLDWETFKGQGEDTWELIANCMLVPNPKDEAQPILYQDYLSNWLKNQGHDITFNS